MSRASRRTLAAACLGLGAVGATVATSQLLGQTSVPVPPPAQPAPAVAREPVSFRDVVKKVVPAVVNIEAKVSADRRPAGADVSLGFGTGVLIDPSGVVLTNYHVVEGADAVEVELHDGRKFTSKDIRRDPKTDLAVVKLTADKPLPSLELGDSDAVEVGDPVLAVGAPFGLTGSVTHGIVSGKSRRNLNLNQYEDFVQTDAAINPGNSGGPLVTPDGKVVGVCAAIKTKSGGFQGVGLAVSSNLARDVARQLMTAGVVRRGYLGVAVRELTDESAVRAGVAKGRGVLVSRVDARSPAAKAGLRAGDVITSVAGTPVRDADALPRVVAGLPLDKPTEVVYIRDGKAVARSVTVEEQPVETGAAPKPAAPAARGVVLHVERAGLSVADLTPEAAARSGYPHGTRGAVIVGIDRSGPAADAGLAKGSVVVKVDGTPVTSAAEFADAAAAADRDRGALVQVLRPTGGVEFVLLKVR